MPPFGNNAQEGLQFKISERGAQETANKFDRLAGSADKVARASGTGATAGIGRLREGLGRLRGMAQNVVGTFARVAGVIGLGGGFAIAGLLKEQVDVERSLSRIAYQGNRSAEEMDRMRDAMNRISGVTGKTRGEILAAIDASTDLGLTWEQAEKHMEQIVLWADLLGVNVDQASGAVAALNRAMGGKGDVPQLMSMLDAASRKSGMKNEGMFFDMITRIMPQMQGMEGLGDINTLMQVVAGLGEELGTDPEAMQAGLRSLNRMLGSERLTKNLEKVGIGGGNAAEVLMQMAQKLAGDAKALDRAQLPDEITFLARVMAGNLEPMRAMGEAVDNAAGKTAEFSARVDEHAQSPEVVWSSTMERLKQAMEPVVSGALNWFADHNEELIAGFKTFMEMLKMAGEAAVWLANKLNPETKTLVSGMGDPMFRGASLNARRGLARIAANAYESNAEITPAEREFLRMRADSRVLTGQTFRPEDFASDLAHYTTASPYVAQGVEAFRGVAPHIGTAIANAIKGVFQINVSNSSSADVEVRQDGRSVAAVEGAGA